MASGDRSFGEFLGDGLMRWVFLCLVSVGVVFVGCGGGTKKESAVDKVAAMLQQYFRDKYGKDIARDSSLNAACAEHAEILAQQGTYTYTSNPGGTTPTQRARNHGYSGTVLTDGGTPVSSTDSIQDVFNALKGVLSNSNATAFGIGKSETCFGSG